MDAPVDARATYERIDEARAKLCELIRTTDVATVTTRPPSGEWSPLENVRHLLFAEQLHFRKLLPDPVKWEAAGLTPHFMAEIPALSSVGANPTTDVGEVLAAWDKVHAATRVLADDERPEAREALAGNLRHLEFHVGIIEALLGDRV